MKQINMGVIICRHCSSLVDTVDTNKIAVFYGVCDKPECRQLHKAGEGSVRSADAP
ncbi:GapA-binding peptide SR1P [Paenibacillus lactis]